MTSKGYSKDELKRLMQQKKDELSTKRIESPLAGYDEDGNLFCKICEFKIENANFWTKHLISKEHKSSLIRKKKGQTIEPQSKEIKKRKLDEQVEEVKKQRVDLIDEEGVKSTDQVSIEKSKEVNEPEGDLPKGFFDNPQEDAKARDEMYKDPLDVEWSKFQRTIQEEEKAVDYLNESDLAETQNYRELTEVDEQLEHWNRINELEIKRDAKKSSKRMEIDRSEQSDQSSDESELGDEFNILSNWRR